MRKGGLVCLESDVRKYYDEKSGFCDAIRLTRDQLQYVVDVVYRFGSARAYAVLANDALKGPL